MTTLPPPVIDLAVFAPHPDDAEIFCGGVIASAVARGQRVAIIDLTRGELATQGTPDNREAEAGEASRVLSLALRENLRLPDGFISAEHEGANGRAQLESVVRALRRLRPQIVLAPYGVDRHPDHSAASALVTKAVFFAGTKNFAADAPPHTARQLLYYQMRTTFQPSFVVDTTAVMETKLAAIRCYRSQIERQVQAGGEGTLISSPLTLSSITARDAFYGAMIGKPYGEPLYCHNAIAIPDPIAHFAAHPGKDALLYPRGL